MTVVIAGCGDLGTEVGLRFAAQGHRVIGLRRSPHRLPSQIEGQAVDLATQSPTLPTDTDILIIATSADRRTVEAYRSAYLDSVMNVLAALENDRPARVLFVSSTAVYGVDDGSWVDETTPAIPTSATAGVLREAEVALHARLPGAVVLRLTGIYGPGRTGLVDRVRDGSETISSRPQFTNRIHRDDAAAAIVHLTSLPTAPETVYVGTDDAPTDRRQVIEFLAGKLGARIPGDAVDAERHGGKRCRNERLRATGFTFSYPSYREGYQAVLDGIGVRHP